MNAPLTPGGDPILSGDNFVVMGPTAEADDPLEACPVRVIAASLESKSIGKWQVEKLEIYAHQFKARVDRQGDSAPDWSWEGWQYFHDALPDAEHMVAYASKWDCLCALLVELTKDLIAEGFGPDSGIAS